MARGGRRQGTPGQNYSNRTDMTLPAQVAPGGTYGTRQQLEAAQRNIPLPGPAAQNVPPPAGPVPQPTQPAGGGAPPMPPLDFARQSERPNEPITAGMPIGAGPGPETMADAPDIIGAQLRALYQASPNNDLLRVLELHQRGY